MTSNSAHILVVDDDPLIRELLAEYLADNELRVSVAADGAGMAAAMAESMIDMVLLDLRLKGEDGMQLARKLREESNVPVIIITGKKDEADRVIGLEFAADDYITKPFSNREVLARIRAVLRRTQTNQAATPRQRDAKCRGYRFDGWELNFLSRRLTAPQGERVDLSNGEFNLLLALCESPRRALSRDQLLEHTRLHGSEVYDRSIDIQVLRLRRKIEVDASEPKYIRTERGVGYFFDAEVNVIY